MTAVAALWAFVYFLGVVSGLTSLSWFRVARVGRAGSDRLDVWQPYVYGVACGVVSAACGSLMVLHLAAVV